MYVVYYLQNLSRLRSLRYDLGNEVKVMSTLSMPFLISFRYSQKLDQYPLMGHADDNLFLHVPDLVLS